MSSWDDYQRGRWGNPALIAQNWQEAQRNGTAGTSSGPESTALAQHLGISPSTGAPAARAAAPRPRSAQRVPGSIPGFLGPVRRPAPFNNPTSGAGTSSPRPPGGATGGAGAPRPMPSIMPRTSPSGGAAPPAGPTSPTGAPSLPPPLPPADFGGLPSARGSIDALGGNVNIAPAARVTAPGTPRRIDPATGLPAAPGREQLGGEDSENQLEQMGRERLAGPIDPGQQYAGHKVSDTVFSDAQINQLAQQQAEPLLRALADEQEQMVAAAAAGGGGVDPAALRALRSRAAATTAAARGGALRDATLAGVKANAAQNLAAAQSGREDFNADIGARLGLGKLGADVGSELLGAGQQQRGLKQARDVSRFTGEIDQRGKEMDYAAEGGRQGLTARGQDVAQRADDIGYNANRLNADVTQRGQDTQTAIAGANLTGENRRTAANLDVERELGLGRLGNEARGQDVSARGQDISAALGLGEQGNQRYGIDTGAANSAAERQARMQELETRLQSERLTDDQRNELERERLALQREMFQGGEAGTNTRFGQSLDEQRRQFDSSQQFAEEQGQRGRNFTREMSGGSPLEQQQQADDARRQAAYNNWIGSNWTGAFGDAMTHDPRQAQVDEMLRQLRQLASAA